MTILILGGRSPIAIALACLLDESQTKTLLVTRSYDNEIHEKVHHLQFCEVVEWDLADTEACLSRLEEREDISGFVALHRYRGSGSPLEQHQVDVLSTYELLRALAARQTSGQFAAVLAVSPAARVVVGNQSFPYHASRSSLLALTRWAASNFASSGLRVNAVSPGAYIQKERSREFYRQNPDRLRWAKWVTPLGREGTCDEVARTITFLLSDDSSFINGQVIEIDGGSSVVDSPGLDPVNGFML